MSVRFQQITENDDLRAICVQMQPGKWADDNEMSSYTPESLRTFLESDNILILAFDGNRIAGAAIAHVLQHPAGDDTLYIHELDTHPEYRRRGVASGIMQEMMTIAKKRGLTEVWLATETDNYPANALYKKLKPYEIEQSVTYAYKVK